MQEIDWFVALRNDSDSYQDQIHMKKVLDTMHEHAFFLLILNILLSASVYYLNAGRYSFTSNSLDYLFDYVTAFLIFLNFIIVWFILFYKQKFLYLSISATLLIAFGATYSLVAMITVYYSNLFEKNPTYETHYKNSRIIVYSTDCGATCAFDFVVDQRTEALPGIEHERILYDADYGDVFRDATIQGNILTTTWVGYKNQTYIKEFEL